VDSGWSGWLGYNFKIPIFKQFFLQNIHIQNCRPVPNCDLRTNTTNLMQISSAVYEQFLLRYSFAKKFQSQTVSREKLRKRPM